MTVYLVVCFGFFFALHYRSTCTCKCTYMYKTEKQQVMIGRKVRSNPEYHYFYSPVLFSMSQKILNPAKKMKITPTYMYIHVCHLEANCFHYDRSTV